MTDQHDDPTGDEPITPEVVRPRGAAGRKRRAGGDVPVPDEPVDASPAPPARGDNRGTMVRVACMLLMAFGFLQLAQFATWVIDPEGARCTLARNRIEFANDDDEDFNDVALPGDAEDVGDLDCEAAVALAGTIPLEEDDEPSGDFLGEAFVRNIGIGMVVLALGQGLAGWFTLRTHERRFRNAALVLAGVGIVLPFLNLPTAGIITLVVFAFVIFALAFSKDAKAFWGGGSVGRPRPPVGSP